MAEDMQRAAMRRRRRSVDRPLGVREGRFEKRAPGGDLLSSLLPQETDEKAPYGQILGLFERSVWPRELQVQRKLPCCPVW